jgi:hypothetical protein
MTFHYTSVQSHSTMTPYGKRVKETLVKVENGKGVKMVSVGDNKGDIGDRGRVAESGRRTRIGGGQGAQNEHRSGR